MHTASHFYNTNYIKIVKILHVLNLIGSSSGYTSNSFVQDTKLFILCNNPTHQWNKLFKLINYIVHLLVITYYNKSYLMYESNLIIF